MKLLQILFKQLKEVHYASINNIVNTESELSEQVRNAEYTLDAMRMECFKLSLTADSHTLQVYFETAELLYLEVYSHNLIRIRRLTS